MRTAGKSPGKPMDPKVMTGGGAIRQGIFSSGFKYLASPAYFIPGGWI
jgi:hypothetical protein